MMILFPILFFGLLLGQLGSAAVAPDVFIYIHDAALVVLFLGAAIRMLMIKRFMLPRLILPIAGFILTAVLSLLTNSGKFTPAQLGTSALYLIRWVMYAGVYVVVVQLKAAAKILSIGLYIWGIAFALLGFIQYTLYPDLRNLVYLGWDPHHYRLVSTLFDPNFAGIMLTLTFLFGLTLVYSAKRKTMYMIGELIVLAAIYLTYSRSSYLALFAGVVVEMVMRKQWKVIAIVMLFVSALVIVPMPGSDTQRLFRVDTSIARIGNWIETIDIIRKRPVFGYGFNTLRYVWNKPPVPEGVVSRATSGVDSSLLFVAATTGIVGLISYIILQITVIRVHFRMLLPPIAALAVHSLFINSAFYPWVMIWMWILVGIAELTRQATVGK